MEQQRDRGEQLAELMFELRAQDPRTYHAAKTLLACMVERKSRKSRPGN
jgi:hypothetical protein